MTLPNVELSVDKREDIKIVGKILERYRYWKIPIEKFEIFPLYDKWLDIALQNDVKDLVCGAPGANIRPFLLPIFKILAAKSLKELVLNGCILTGVSLSSSGANCCSLRKLSLFRACLSDDMLQTILNSCPLIVSFILEEWNVLKRIELRNLQKIMSVSISAFNDQLVKIQAPTLEHLSCFGGLGDLLLLETVKYHNPKSLELSRVRISDGLLDGVIATSQFLETLTLNHISKGLETFNIYKSLSLKVFMIEDCGHIGEIDAPNLESLEYKEDQVLELKMLKFEYTYRANVT